MKILLPTDGSITAKRALGFAANFSKTLGGEVIVLSVNKFRPEFYGLPPGVAGRLEDDISAGSLLLAKETTKKLLDEGVKASYRTAVGDPAAKIIELAKEEAVDMIIMGTQGLTGLARTMLGSVADRVVRMAICPVLLVPNKSD